MGKETILILDADNNITWTLKNLFENEAYPVIIARTIERALKDFFEFQVSGMITEYRIGHVSTLEVVRKVKEMFPETYVMMLTDKETKEDEYEEIMRAGIDDYFLKPIPIKKILLHLKKGLRYRSLLLEKKRLDKEVDTFNLIYPEPETQWLSKGEEKNEDHS